MINTIARNAGLEDISKLLKVQHDAKHDAIIPAEAIIATHDIEHDHMVLSIDGMGPDGPAGDAGEFRVTDIFEEGLSEKLGIPLKYLRTMREKRPDLYEANLNGWLQGNADWEFPADPRRFFVRTFTDPDGGYGIARALLSDTYRRIDNLDVLLAALDGIRNAGVDAEVEKCQLSDRRMVVDVACPGVGVVAQELLKGYRSPFAGGAERAGGWTVAQARRAAAAEGQGYEPGEEPIVYAGFQISNSETGGGAFNLVPRVIFQPCKNGLKLAGEMLHRVHIGGRLDEGTVAWSDATQQKNLELVSSMTSDAITSWLNVDYVKKVVTDLEARDHPVENPSKVVELVGNRMRFTESQVDGILDHFIHGGQITAAGVMQAVTSYAQTVESPDEAYELENAAMEVFAIAAAV